MNADPLVIDTTARILGELCGPEVVTAAEDGGAWPRALWEALEESALTRAWIPEELGGPGTSLADGFAIARIAGAHATPAPLAETLLAGWLASDAGLEPPEGPLTVAPVSAGDSIALEGDALVGSATCVPFARACRHVVVVFRSMEMRSERAPDADPQGESSRSGSARGRGTGTAGDIGDTGNAGHIGHTGSLANPYSGSANGITRDASTQGRGGAPSGDLRSAMQGVAIVERATCVIDPGTSLAGELQDTVVFDGVIPIARSAPGVTDRAQRLRWMGAVLRAEQMAGGLECCLEQSLQYAADRRQFGRPIAKFQAVQHNLAVLAGEVAAATTSADAAASALARHGFEDDRTFLAVATAKIRTGQAAGAGAGIAHQVHGAMGFTREYSLQHRTRRLWAWRDEFDPETTWAIELGRHVARRGGEALWGTVTAV